ncbi:MAG: hypothetical protein RL497_2977 [Pseudomonadota bacterium]|jgi:hypothetical protein
MTHLAVKTIALTALSVALAACGNGKDSGTAKVDSKPVVDNRAAGITADNLETVLATAFQIAADTGPGTTDSETPRPAYMIGNVGDGLANVGSLQSEGKFADSATGLVIDASKTVCAQGGEAAANLGLDTASLGTNGLIDFTKFYVDFGFSNCKVSQYLVNGKAKVALSSLSGIGTGPRNSTIIIKLTAELDRFFVVQSTGGPDQYDRSLDVTGKVEFSLSNPNSEYIRAELNGIPGSSLLYKVRGSQDQFVQLKEFETYLQSSMRNASYEVGIKGNFLSVSKPNANSASLPTGRLKFYLEKPITGQGFAVPHSGTLVVESDNEIARFEILNQVDLRYTLDKNKNGIIEKDDTEVETTWAEFLSKNLGLNLPY